MYLQSLVQYLVCIGQVAPQRITILTPYKNQVACICQHVRDDIDGVYTVDQYQGWYSVDASLASLTLSFAPTVMLIAWPT
jgi:hypothetical protein